MASEAFWSGKRVFLTGHTGFKGSWLALWLQRLGAEVCGYALEPTTPSLFALAGVDEGMISHIADIRDADKLADALTTFRPDIVLHLAAQPLVRLSYEDPIGTYATNVMGTVHLLEAARKCATVQAAVVVTSDKCYENQEWLWGYRENEPMGGYDPYSNSKGCAELVTSAYRQSYLATPEHPERGFLLASGRAGNVIGGGDWAKDRLVPDILAAFERGEAINIRFPHAVRPWQHVLESLSGYLLLAERLVGDGLAFAEPWNFGPDSNSEKTVAHITDYMCSQWGGEARWTQDGAQQPHEAKLLKLDSSKARIRLGWTPRWDVEQALDATLSWHRAYLAGENMKDVTLSQIDGYQDGSGHS